VQRMSSTTQTRNRMPSNTALAVDAEGLVKVFGENKAVDGVNLTVPVGSGHTVEHPTTGHIKTITASWHSFSLSS
jgi:hypothetical protein